MGCEKKGRPRRLEQAAANAHHSRNNEARSATRPGQRAVTVFTFVRTSAFMPWVGVTEGGALQREGG